MSLSNDLISQFVKVTNDKPETKTETTVYGTTKEYEGKMYVQLDGSDLLTPVQSTATAKPEERVTVMIKNHSATITGNISSPSARNEDVTKISDAVDKIEEFEIIVADKVDVTALNAVIARVDQLVTEDVKIKGTLNAVEANIETLEAKDVEINGKLTTANADISKLKTDKLDANIAEITFATIESLEGTNADLHNLEATYALFANTTTNKLTANEADISELAATHASFETATAENFKAQNADITSLEADIANIDTLIFGSATGSTIQTSFANAVIAQLGNAQIKSAMIKSISAEKITSGDIITNNVSVKSSDGKLLISDETIQISDSTRVRVQIGKDTNNDYSINIWDASGNLMFSEGGITDSAIKNAIIRNDMVSDDANIEAHKLNIASLFEEINGSDKTIKSTRIYLDDKEQTLDVAFESVTTDIDELQNGVSSQGTQITALQGKITSKVWKADIDSAVESVETKTDTLSTKYTTLEQDLNSISATVAEHTSEINSKADSSKVTEVNTKLTSLETNLSGFKASVSSTYATKTDVSTAKTEAISTASTDAQTKANKALTDANTNTSNLLKSYSTTVEMQSAITASADSIKSSVKSTYATKESVESIDIGGRNYYRPSQVVELGCTGLASGEQTLISTGSCVGFYIPVVAGEQWTLSRDQATNNRFDYCFTVDEPVSGTLVYGWDSSHREDLEIVGIVVPEGYNYMFLYLSNQNDDMPNIKLEKGNKVTDWSPAPEDMATTNALTDVQSSMTLTEERVTTAETLIQQLSNSISTLVTDGNGQSLMTQTESGWTFSTREIQDVVDVTSENLDKLTNDVGDVNSAVGILQEAVSDLGLLNEYIKIGTYEGQPCIELGEDDSEFRLLITNTEILFMEGTGIPAYISNQALNIKKAVVEEEFQQGDFVWKARSNGNLGLVWRG